MNQSRKSTETTYNMKYLIIFAVAAVCTLARPQEKPSGYYEPNEYEKRQNEAARYQFSTNIDDHISDLTHQRTEVRDGLAVRGMYTYSDGYYKRTVKYVADDKGYRIVGMEAVPLDGPHVDLSGTASVQSAAHGTHVAYKVQSIPIEGPISKVIGDH
ncbi:uncharacterized protein LOC143193800 [Rhynchophorus ferrugineus]|uniref:uncharacterized protein LOC143193800 n=1 Tax=Rhynchophorus ferrugineus TaxID=354439 RepID=UPI003FCE808D